VIIESKIQISLISRKGVLIFNMKLKKIGIDVENGDVVNGQSVTERMAPAIARFSAERPDVEIYLHGEEDKIRDTFSRDILDGVGVIPASEFYSQDDKITRPVRGSVLNNLAVGVANGDIDGYFSIGDTSKIVVEALKISTKGVGRSLVAVLPGLKGDFVCSDIGLSVPTSRKLLYSKTVDGWAHDIYTQGLMATVYVHGWGVSRPRWGIMSNGHEDHKGSDVDNRLEKIIRHAQDEVGLDNFVDYRGKIEPSNCFKGEVDVVLTDGYKGNLFLKSIEGSLGLMSGWIKEEVGNFSLLDKARLAPAAGVIKSAKENIAHKVSPDKYNGAIILGYDGVIVKGHGNSSSNGIYYGLCSLADCTSEDAGPEMVDIVRKYTPKK